LPSLPHINVAGAITTGTHGGSPFYPILASNVTRLQLVTPSGEVLNLRKGHTPNFQ